MQKITRAIARYRIPLLVVIATGAVIFIGQQLTSSSSTSSSTSDSISQATVTKGTVTSSVSASGSVQTANYLAITTSVNGIVKQVFVKEGQTVSQGQKIMEVTLDSDGERSRTNAYASYLKSKTSLESSKDSLLTLESSVASKKNIFENEKRSNSYQSRDERTSYLVAENDYLKSQEDLTNKKAEITQLEMSLQSAWSDYQSQSPIITAPSEGIIANIVAVEGTKISNSVSERSVQTVASIKKDGTPIASVDVTELDINSIQVGQKVKLKLNSLPNESFTGSVVGIDKIGSVQSGVTNYPIIVKFDSASDKVLPNMSVSAEIINNEKKDALLIPTSAIKDQNGKKTVSVEKNGDTTLVEVQTGITGSSETEITGGLNEGDTVLIESLPTSGFTTTTSQQNQGGGSLFGLMRR